MHGVVCVARRWEQQVQLRKMMRREETDELGAKRVEWANAVDLLCAVWCGGVCVCVQTRWRAKAGWRAFDFTRAWRAIGARRVEQPEVDSELESMPSDQVSRA